MTRTRRQFPRWVAAVLAAGAIGAPALRGADVDTDLLPPLADKPPAGKAPASRPAAAPATPSTTGGAFANFWPTYARRYAAIGTEYFACAAYDPQYPSSRGVKVEEVIDSRTKVVFKEVGRGRVLPDWITIQRAEAEAMTYPLPEVGVG